MVRPDRFELPTFWFVARRSIQLSYGRAKIILPCALRSPLIAKIERVLSGKPPTVHLAAPRSKSAGERRGVELEVMVGDGSPADLRAGRRGWTIPPQADSPNAT